MNSTSITFALPDGAAEEKHRPDRRGSLRIQRSRRGRRGHVGDIQQTEVVREEERRMHESGIVSFERRLCEENGLDPERQHSKFEGLLRQHTERLQESNSSMDEYDGDFLDFLGGSDRRLSQISLNDLVVAERQRNNERRPSRRCRETIIKMNAWHQKFTLKQALELARQSSELTWLKSFYRCDPRWQIMRFFDEVAREGGDVPVDECLAASPLPNLFNKASVFTVWRPTSNEAIKNMMLGVACGKGLDIKGKSAKQGNISSYVPFIQVFEEKHLVDCKAYLKPGKTIRIFYSSEESRLEAYDVMSEFLDKASSTAQLNIKYIDSYVDSTVPVFGLEVTEHLFWESYVATRDCSRPQNTEWNTGRNSMPAFMEMNLDTIRHDHEPGEPRSVVFQMSESDPMEPRMLLMAYEENGGVKPVVSDFDCFILGTRGVRYEKPIPPEQVELVKWSVDNIGRVLDARAWSGSKDGWTETWIEVRKRAAEGYYPVTPKFGNGDPKSYEIIEVAVSRLRDTGCVRHGAECFNWFFPQEIDDEFLVISDTLPGNIKWRKVNVRELQDLLIAKIEEGFTFPINPKWILCDSGWRRVYDKLLSSQKPNVQDSINCWLPPESGLREEIDNISVRHPHGFERNGRKVDRTSNAILMNDLEKYLQRYMKMQRAMRKVKMANCLIKTAQEKKVKKGGSGRRASA